MKTIAVLDLETDPFEYGHMIQPFVAGFYDGTTYAQEWGLDCVPRMVAYLRTRKEPLVIYAHNGGRFDYFWFIPYFHAALKIVNGRIIQAHMPGTAHEFRDSYAIMPFALDKFQKTEIDYRKFSKRRREKHRAEICSYLKDDCVNLHTLCVRFRQEFGDALTIGSASMKQLKQFHSFRTGVKEYDERIREKFYFGGRNQVFRAGHIHQPIAIYDVNSMYPAVMRDELHPISTGIHEGRKIDSKTCFIETEGHNYGAFPQRTPNGSLDFTVEYGTFTPTIHEWNAALDTGTFRPKRIIQTYGFSERINFAEFINHFYDARLKAGRDGDRVLHLFYKFVMNSSYGKFAQNPENYSNWFLTAYGDYPPEYHQCSKGCDDPCRKLWTPSFVCNDYMLWSRPANEQWYFNVSTGASITGAARARLLRGISQVADPLYCDTDSIICRAAGPKLDIDPDRLGAWKLEGTGDHAAICGKKLYAIFNRNKCIKKAHKGAELTAQQIYDVASGRTVESCNPVPAFKWDGTYSWTHRTIKRTA